MSAENPRAFQGNERFEVLRQIGAGGMGVVYAVRDRQTGNVVALKTLHGFDAASLLHLKAEFRALSAIHHENLLQLGEFFVEGGQWFFTMEMLEGVDIDTWVSSTPLQLKAESTGHTATVPVPPKSGLPGIDLAKLQEAPEAALEVKSLPQGVFDETRVRDAFRGLAVGLQHLHANGKLHRDLKPANVMVTLEGRVVILDFGLVSDVRTGESVDSALGMIIGTPLFMPPEQATGKPTSPASDWYSFGATLYQVLAGRPPFEGTSIQVIFAKQSRDPPPPSTRCAGIPADLDRLCMALLHRDPEARAGAVEVFEVLGGLPDSTSSLGEELGGLSDALLLGRDEELAELDAWMHRVAAGRPVSGLVSGSSGVGKTALVERFLDKARDEGSLVLRGRCYERESVPYKTMDSLVDGLVLHLRRLGKEERADLLPPHINALARLFPSLWGVKGITPEPSTLAGAPEDPRLVRRRAVEALKVLLTRLAQPAPVVLFVDDLQWGDVDGAILLTEIISSPAPPPLLLLACYRHGEVSSEPILDVFMRAAHAGVIFEPRQLKVEALSRSRATDLALSLLGQDDPGTRGLARRIAEESAGSPFFVRELAWHVVHGELAATEMSDPEKHISLSRLLAKRLERLEDEERQLLETVVVAGRPLEQGVALRAASVHRRTGGPLDSLRAGRLIRTQGPSDLHLVETWHDRIRAAVGAGIGPEDLRRHHGELAHCLEERGSQDPEWLAAHFEGAGELPKAIDYLEQAAKSAFEALAFERAARLYCHLIELTERDGRLPSPELLEICGDACLEGGLYDQAALRFAMRLDLFLTTRLHRSELLRKSAEVEVRRGRTAEAAVMLEEVLEGLGWPVPRSQLGLALRLGWNMFRGLMAMAIPGMFTRARRAEGLEIQELTARVCNRLAEAFYWIDFQRSIYYQWAALNVARGIGPGDELTVACAQIGYAMTAYGQPSIGRRVLARALEMAEVSASFKEQAWTAAMEAMSHGCSANMPRYLEASVRSEELLEKEFEPMRARAIWTIHAEAMMMMGRLDAASEQARRIWRLSHELSDERGRGWALMLLGIAAARRGRSSASESLRQAMEHSRLGGDEQNQINTAARLAHVLATTGEELDEAVTLSCKYSSRLAERQLRHPTGNSYGVCLGVLGLKKLRDGTLEPDLEAAAMQALKLGRPYARCLACTRPLYLAGLATWQLAEGRRDRALLSFDQAVEAARSCGLEGELHDVHALAATAFSADDPERGHHAAAQQALRKRFLGNGKTGRD